MPKGNETHMSVTDAASMIGVTSATIRAWIDKGEFKDVRRPSPRVILINRKEVEEKANINYFAN